MVDDLGLPISGATVTFTPNDGESGTAAQTLVTDSDGKATVYVKRGSYTLTATHERFTSAITQTDERLFRSHGQDDGRDSGNRSARRDQ